jgi:hypothetical protein
MLKASTRAKPKASLRFSLFVLNLTKSKKLLSDGGIVERCAAEMTAVFGDDSDEKIEKNFETVALYDQTQKLA